MGAAGVDFNSREALESKPSDNGAIELVWDKPTDTVVVLEQSANADFTSPIERYRGTDAGSVITGLAEGVHFFRLRAVDGADDTWSEPLRVEVAFYPESKLFVLLGIGAVVVSLTIGTILYGAIRTQNEERSAS
ncbi:hypothetical protein JIN77_11615 [Verrucomicrobiaceae bacterium R5-34]|nr:hypothetical protein [Verrucomicrobiaceae bacterium R5-34]